MDGISAEEALRLLNIDDELELYTFFKRASDKRREVFGDKITTCSIINARCGGCPEDCAFCAQSRSSKADIKKYPLIPEDEMLLAASNAVENKTSNISVVTSGRAVNASKELDSICSFVEKISRQNKIKPCASLGILNKEALKKLKDAGLSRYHHNLEAAESYFKSICSTRSYEDQIDTIKAAKELGLSLCVGGIFGMGESKEQRIELLETIRSLDVDSVPLNFLSPILGTKLENMKDLSPLDCLKIIASARLMMPDKTIRICGGRENNLRDFQSWIFFAGANGLMVGGYLVTSGRDVNDDLQMIKDAGLSL
jgi:biotin synthase